MPNSNGKFDEKYKNKGKKSKEFFADKTLHGLFKQIATKWPKNIAIILNNQQVTYSELDQKSTIIANFLMSEKIPKETLIAIDTSKSAEAIISILGILKAGCAYVPIDLEWPRKRINQIITDCKSPLILTHNKNTKLTSIIHHVTYKDMRLNTFKNVSSIKTDIHENNLAYVIYTSGSTGKPKGVMIEHKAVVNTIIEQIKAFKITSKSRTLGLASLCFDASISEIFTTLLAGGTLVLMKKNYKTTIDTLIKVLVNYKITVATVPPSLLMKLPKTELPDLKTLVSAGEQCSKKVADIWSKNRLFINAYGLTETAICATLHVYQKKTDKISIGRPLKNVNAYVLDKMLNKLPANKTGELYIGGVGLARGYLNQASLTQERFIQYKGEHIYQTGDLVKKLPNGQFEFIGRNDNQIKLNGFRIELEEIEYQLLRHPKINEAVVILEQRISNACLKAYIATNNTKLTNSTLKDYLSNYLPRYSIPSIFILVKTLPLTTSGKIDRKILQKYHPPTTFNHIKPSSYTEKKLAGIWTKLLDIKKSKISVSDDFMFLGGHSLLLHQLLIEINKTFNIKIDAATLFKNTSIASQANLIDKYKKNPDCNNLKTGSKKIWQPLSSSQEQIWLQMQLAGNNSPLFNEPAMLIIPTDLNVKIFENALNTLLSRHAMLRARFTLSDNSLMQKITPFKPKTLPYVDLTDILTQNQDDIIKKKSKKITITPFNLETDPIARFILFKLEENSYKMFITIHHLVMDGVSMNIILKELEAIYYQLLQKNIHDLPPLNFSYFDFVQWNRAYCKKLNKTHIQYWRKQIAKNIPLKLPIQKKFKKSFDFAGAIEIFTISKKETALLKKLSKQKKVTMFITLFTIFNILLYRYTHKTDFLIGTVVSGRYKSAFNNIVGNFLNTIAIRTHIKSNLSFATLLNEIRNNMFEAYSHQHVPFQEAIKSMKSRNFNNNSLPLQISFIFEPPQQQSAAGWELSQSEMHTDTSKFDLTFELSEINNRIVARVEYSAELFNKQSIKLMTNHYKNLVKKIISNPGVNIDNIDFLTNTEKRMLTRNYGHTSNIKLPTQTVTQLFETQVAATPNKIAIIAGNQNITYLKLNDKASALGTYITTNITRQNPFIVLCVDRNIDMLVSMVAILKAGCAYVPIEPSHPQQRIQKIINDCLPELIITQTKYKHLFEKAQKTKIILLDDIKRQFNKLSKTKIKQTSSHDDILYAIYTSGSSGTPKGVLINHKNALNYILWFKKKFDFNAKKIIDFSSSFAFDLSVTSTLLPLALGATISICSQEIKYNPKHYLNYLKKNKINYIKCTPTYFQQLLSFEKLIATLDKLEYIILGGEQLYNKYVKQWFAANKKQKIVNEFGPTEATVATAAFVVNKNNLNMLQNSDAIPIGFPSSNTNIYILDHNNNLCPTGIYGELCISGCSISKGYLNNSKLTQEKFVGYDGQRIYKTGDLARWSEKGYLEYMGRIGDSVKIRGYRVNCGEVKTALLKHKNIAKCTVIPKKTVDNTNYLVAYIVSTVKIESTEINHFLCKIIPEYMMPTEYVFLDKLTLTSNDKVDENFFKTNASAAHAKFNINKKISTTERTLIKIWSKHLNLPQIKINDNFFYLGGHSLLALTIISDIEKEFNKSMNFAVLFSHPTISELANFIKK